MSDLIKVTGSDCLSYINRDIGFINKEIFGMGINQTFTPTSSYYDVNVERLGTSNDIAPEFNDGIAITKFAHNTSKRIVGLVQETYEDGGMKVAILGNEPCDIRDGGYIQAYNHLCVCKGDIVYNQSQLTGSYEKRDDYGTYPEITNVFNSGSNKSIGWLTTDNTHLIPFDEMIDYTPTPHFVPGNLGNSRALIEYKGTSANDMHLTSDKNNTMVFGQGVHFNYFVYFNGSQMYNPLNYIAGNLYSLTYEWSSKMLASCPREFEDGVAFSSYDFHFGQPIMSTNLVSICYNLILTESENFAREYLNNGTLPPDAFLFPLDWESFPRYDGTPEDNPDDEPNDNMPDDNSRDVTPNLPEVPTYTPSMLSNYNWYWLSVPDYGNFLNWFWNDIGAYNDFDDLINKVKGLYNDVASAVLMVRYFPVEYGWITNNLSVSNAPTGNIKVGMIEKQGAVTCIDQSHAPILREIGSINIPKKYKSFCDLEPYTKLSMYLPYHGFVDLDVDILVGHTLNVKGVYDYLTGTIQYYLYCDNEMLINTFIAKMAVDVPITLQTKNDRDSAVFSNVSSAVGGLIGAGSTIATGNPVGMLIGASAINNTMASAPLNVKGTVGESGALYGPSQCAIILRRPTIQSSDKGSSLDTWKKNVGQLCGYGYTLSGLEGSGLTVCHSPRITFTKTTPLQTEVDEIYDYLMKGVIL